LKKVKTVENERKMARFCAKTNGNRAFFRIFFTLNARKSRYNQSASVLGLRFGSVSV
jgi:hypothetical protein